MITTGSKFWFGVTGAALVAAFLYAVASGGEKVGTYVLVFLVFASFFLGMITVATRDGATTPQAAAVPEGDGGVERTEPADGEGAAALGRPAPPAPWPVAAAFGAGVVVVGLAAGGWLFYVGLAILVVVAVEWMVQGWAERASADPAFNRALRNQIMYPIEIPALALIILAAVVLAFSRVLLALPQLGSTLVAIVVATVILAVAALVASRPRLPSNALSILLVVAAVAALGGGIVGAVVGEREFEHHEVEPAEEPAEPDAGVEADAEAEGGG